MGVSKYKESAPGLVYHIYNRGNHKQDIFFDNSDYRFYLAMLKRYSIKCGISIVAYCLMVNHLHLLIRQNGIDSPTKMISRLHTAYSMYINKKYDKVGHLFQGRFKQKIVDNDDYLKQLVSYIHLNPVKDGLATEMKQYRWSSYAWYVGNSRAKRTSICDSNVITSLDLLALTEQQMKNQANKLNSRDTLTE